MALLQPAPKTFDLFDELVLLSEGYLVYQGPREEVLEYFESLGFQLPPRKGIADFLQEVTSKKDQARYWADASKPYVFLSVSKIAEAFRNSKYERDLPFETIQLNTMFSIHMVYPAVVIGLELAEIITLRCVFQYHCDFGLGIPQTYGLWTRTLIRSERMSPKNFDIELILFRMFIHSFSISLVIKSGYLFFFWALDLRKCKLLNFLSSTLFI